MSKCGVYKIRCVKTGRFYIGSAANIPKRIERHFLDLENGEHHNIFLQRVYNKYGRKAMKVTVVATTSTVKAARRLEQKQLDKHADNDRLLNIGRTASGGDNLTANPNRKKIVAKITRAVRKQVNGMTEAERKRRFSKPGKKNGMYGKTHTEESRKKMSDALTGRPSHGTKHTESTKRRLSKIAKAKVSKRGYVNPFAGKKHSHETKALIAKKAKGRLPPNTKKVRAGGKTYVSLTAAAKAYDVTPYAMLYRIRSDKQKFKGFYYV